MKKLSFDFKGINEKIFDEDGECIACKRIATFTDDDIAARYGALFEAAPELLAECKRGQGELASALRDGFKNHFNKEMLGAWFRGATAAIEAAEGIKAQP